MSDASTYENTTVREMLTSEGWQEASRRLEVVLVSLRQRICKHPWVTPEQLRELAYLQGQESFLQALIEHPVETFAQGLEKEPPAQTMKPGVGWDTKRARPRGF